MSTEVSLTDEQPFYAGIADVRSDSSDTNWALFGHYDNNPNEIYYISSGEGGTEEMVENMDDAQVLYGLVRLTETIDVSTTVKFAYIHWVGSDFPFTKRGKYGVVHGSIEKYFDPYHVLVDDVDTKEELTTDYIMAKIQGTSGTRSKVLDTSEAKQRPERGFTSGTTTKADVTGATPTQSANLGKIGRLGSSFTGIAQQSKGTGGLRFDDEVGQAIDDVRNDTSETNWMVCSYEDGNVKKPIVLKGSGSGGLEELKDNFTDDSVAYALFRVTDVVDDIPTVKFVFIQWVGEGVKPMTKAKITPHKGALEDVFRIYIFATLASEISQRAVMDKVTSASGSKSHVK